MIIPFFYFFRMPLFLGILVNLGLIKERDDEDYYKHGIGEFLSKHNYNLMNITEYQHRDDKIIMKATPRVYAR